MDKKNVVHIDNGILLVHNREWNIAICSNMYGSGDYHKKWSKSGRERQILHDITYSVFSHSVTSDSVTPMDCSMPGLCHSSSPKICPSSCPLHKWRHPAISSSDAHFSFCPQSFPVSGTFPTSQLFASNDQNTGVSASTSVLRMGIQSWFPLRLTGLTSLLSKGLSGVFSSTTVQRYQFFNALPPILLINWPLIWGFHELSQV